MFKKHSLSCDFYDFDTCAWNTCWVVRYWDTYPDGVIATCDTEEEAEKIRKEYLRNRKPMYDYLVREEDE